MRARPILALALLGTVVYLAACDSGGGGGLQASYFVGAWRLDTVTDDTGDRTALVRERIDVLDLSFVTDGRFSIEVDYAAAVNQAGVPDTTLSGAYAVSASGALVLTFDNQTAVGLTVTTQGNDRAALRLPAVLANQLLAGSAVDLGLVGTVALGIRRRA